MARMFPCPDMPVLRFFASVTIVAALQATELQFVESYVDVVLVHVG